MTRLVLLAGPTASGKTAVAVRLAKALKTDIVSCDSMQVYKGMPIVTQAASAKELGKVKSRLTAFLDPSEEYSAARFREDALKYLAAAEKKGRPLLVVGGTGLYFRALLDGLFEHEGPSRDLALREKMLKEEEKHGPGHLHAKLARVDAAAAAKIHPNDVRRTVRALEVYELTGEPFSAQKANRTGLRAEGNFRLFFLERDRAELYARIDKRVDAMAKAGLVREVKRLLKKDLSQTALMALGVRQVAAHLEGKATLAEALDTVKKETRHYAKRQLSWFRHERDVERITVAPGEKPAATAKKILELLKK